MKYPHDVQQEIFKKLIATAKNTEFGKKHGFNAINSYEDYKNNVPVQSYEDLFPLIERLMKGEQNIYGLQK